MKIPLTPPNIKQIIEKALDSGSGDKHFLENLRIMSPLSEQGEYIHWDKLRHLTPPNTMTIDIWWCLIKLARMALYKPLPFNDKFGNAFVFAMPDSIWKKLHDIDHSAGLIFNTPISLNNTHIRDNYLTQSLIEEAITSSQLEGASTTRKIAKEMLLTKRKPKDKSEQMIFNNYKAMQFVRDMKNEDLTESIILELHRVLTENTLDDPAMAGTIRTTDDIRVVDDRDNTTLHEPPKHTELRERLKNICTFANTNETNNNTFIHPIIKGIILHFMLAYDHPFVDGNGRTARALFYWSVARGGYWMMEYISISSVIKKASSQYAKSFLYTETDGCDITYFINHQLDVILNSIKLLNEHIIKQRHAIRETEEFLYSSDTLKSKLNYRQVALIRHALKHPNSKYVIQGHRESHNISYQTARTDLMNLMQLGLLVKRKVSNAFVFVSPTDLKKRIEEYK